MRESRQLDDKMRDAYSQLRRSAYELGSSAQPMDDSGGVRIKAPRSASTPNAMQSHNREVTLLENGMIVEHVDVRMEERERKKKKNEKKLEVKAAKAKEQTEKQATWQKFAKKSEKKGIHIAGVAGTSIFKTPENPLGRGQCSLACWSRCRCVAYVERICDG